MSATAGTNKVPCRNELRLRIPMSNGTLKTVLLRDRLAVEDPYLKLVKAKLHAIKLGTTVAAEVTSRTLKDILIKRDVQI